MTRQNANANIFGALRLCFALAVIFDHVWEVNFAGARVDPLTRLFPDIGTGPTAVAGFFAVSGLLISQSAVRNRARRFLLLRAARLYPGWVVAVFVVPLGLEPILYAIVHGSLAGAPWLGAHSLLSYGPLNLGIVQLQTTVPGVVARGMMTGVDGPLWTIKWEVLCYLIGLACVTAGRRLAPRLGTGAIRRLPGIEIVLAWSVCGLMVVVRVALAHHLLSAGQTAVALPVCVDLFAFFLCFGIGLRPRPWLASARLRSAVLVLLVGLIAAHAWDFAGEFLFPLGVVMVGSMPVGGWLASIGRRWDISYGIYLYAWPIQQMLAVHHVLVDRLYLLYPLTVLLVLPLALTSWWLVESRALAVVHRRGRARPMPATLPIAPVPLPGLGESGVELAPTTLAGSALG